MQNIQRGLGLFAFTVISTLIFFTPPTHANECAMEVLRAAKAAGSNSSKMNRVYDLHFGEVFAKHAMGRAWYKPATSHQKQTEFARKRLTSIAGRFAKFANATFAWRGNVATVTLGKEVSIVTVHVVSGCKIADICVKNTGCAAKAVGSYLRHVVEK